MSKGPDSLPLQYIELFLCSPHKSASCKLEFDETRMESEQGSKKGKTTQTPLCFSGKTGPPVNVNCASQNRSVSTLSKQSFHRRQKSGIARRFPQFRRSLTELSHNWPSICWLALRTASDSESAYDKVHETYSNWTALPETPA